MIKIYKNIHEYNEVIQSLKLNQKFTLSKFDHNSRGSYYQTIYIVHKNDYDKISVRECK